MKSRLSFVIVCFLCTGLWNSLSQATPLITDIRGIVSEGQEINISGTGFGAVGPTIVIFDDFEKGRAGDQIATKAGTAAFGNWDYTKLTVTYSNSHSHSGNQSLHSDWGSDGLAEGNRLVGKRLGAATELFFSWWQYVPVDAHVPGSGGPYGPNWKFFWLFGPKFPQSDYIAGLITDNLPPPRADYVGFGLQNDVNLPKRYSLGWLYPVEFKKGQWKRFDQYLKWGTASNGHFGLWELKSAGYHQWANARNVTTGHDGEIWEHIHFPGYGRGDSKNAHTYYDDIYIAKGAGARARVEIGNKSVYTQCSNLAITTPKRWTDTRITATIRQGSFTLGSEAFLFIIDSHGIASAGFPVFIKKGSN